MLLSGMTCPHNESPISWVVIVKVPLLGWWWYLFVLLPLLSFLPVAPRRFITEITVYEHRLRDTECSLRQDMGTEYDQQQKKKRREKERKRGCNKGYKADKCERRINKYHKRQHKENPAWGPHCYTEVQTALSYVLHWHTNIDKTLLWAVIGASLKARYVWCLVFCDTERKKSVK